MLIMKFKDTRVHCSGRLVTPKFGLSAGHCFTRDINPHDYVSPDDMSLFFGVSDVNQITGKIPFRVFKIQKRKIKEVLTHPGYKYPMAYNDVSVIGNTLIFDQIEPKKNRLFLVLPSSLFRDS